MAFKILISREAEVELGVAECYFRTMDVHDVFLKDFFKQINFLETTPFSFQKEYKDIRILLFDEFNYSIHFVIREDTVHILRILNQRQNF